MRARFGRLSAVTSLLLAIFADLRRRAWWAYRRDGMYQYKPRPAVVMRQEVDRRASAPALTADWRKVAAQALPVAAAALAFHEDGMLQPVMWIDAGTRPDITDLPRVLRSTQQQGDQPLVVTQWLADSSTAQTVLVVTFVEPVGCTWAMRLDIVRWRAVLEYIAITGQVIVALAEPPALSIDDPLPVLPRHNLPLHLLLPITTFAQLRAILQG